jgi:hypothetical protein
MDRVLASEARGCGFDPRRPHQSFPGSESWLPHFAAADVDPRRPLRNGTRKLSSESGQIEQIEHPSKIALRVVIFAVSERAAVSVSPYFAMVCLLQQSEPIFRTHQGAPCSRR